MTDQPTSTVPTSVLTPPERRRRNREEMTQAILDAARVILREDGVASLNLNTLARRVGMTTPALYGYFPSRSGIYDALFQLAGRTIAAQEDAIWRSTPPDWTRIRAWFEARMAFAQEHPELHQLIFGGPIPGFEPSDTSHAFGRAQVDALLLKLGEVIDAGVIESGLSKQRTIDLLLALRHGIVAERRGKAAVMASGSTRFAYLVEDALALLEAAWTPRSSTTDDEPVPHAAS